MAKLSIRDLDLKGKLVFIRVDFNVPLAPGGKEITSDKRIRASLPTIQYALDHGAGVILASHLGRPKGKPNPEMSLKPVAERLQQAPRQARQDGAGLHRTRSRGHAARSPAKSFCSKISASMPKKKRTIPASPNSSRPSADVYVNDAFGSAHRAHASTVGMIQFMPEAAAGLLMDKELEYLGKATTNPDRPCVAILGGAKVSDKIEVIQT